MKSSRLLSPVVCLLSSVLSLLAPAAHAASAMKDLTVIGNTSIAGNTTITGNTTYTGTVDLGSAAVALPPSISLASLSLAGTGGAGFVDLAAQSGNPAAPTTSHLRLFANSANKFAWIGASGYVRNFDGTLTASRTYTLPDANSSLPVFGQTITFAGPTAARTITLPDANVTLADTTSSQTLSSKTLGNATVTGTLNGTPSGGGLNLDAVELSRPPVYWALPTEASIRTMGARATAAGGGTVMIPAGNITLTAPIVLTQGVHYQGAPYNWNGNGDVGAGISTTLVGDGTFNCFEFHPTDNPDLTSAGHPNMVTDMLMGGGLSDLIIKNFNYGVKIGAANMGGMTPVSLQRLLIRDCTQWGLWLENSSAGRLVDVQCYFNHAGQVGFFASDRVNNWGNYVLDRVTAVGYSVGGVGKSRNFVINARNGATFNALTMINIDGLAGNAGITLSSQTATITNGSVDIAVTDVSRFIPGTAVAFSATTGNILANVIYFVYQVSGTTGAGTIRISSDLLGISANHITPSASGTPLLKTSGCAAVEIAGTEGGSVTFMSMLNCDIEQPGTVGLLLQEAVGCTLNCGLIQPPNDGYSVSLCARSDSNFMYSNHVRLPQSTARVDLNSASKAIGLAGGQATTFTQGYFGVGANYNTLTGEGSLSLVGQSSRAITQNNLSYVRWDGPPRLRHSVNSIGAGTIDPVTNGNIHVYSGSGTTNLPLITTDTFGLPLVLTNPNSVYWPVSAQGSQKINNRSGITSFVVPPFSTAVCVASSAVAPFYWTVTISSDRAVVVPVGSLPAAATNQGQTLTVTDANATTAGTTVAGGGANIVQVWSNGTNWLIR